MLINCKLKPQDPIAAMVAQVNGNSGGVNNIRNGVYVEGSFNFNMSIGNKFEEYPGLKSVGAYGVCDSIENLLEREPMLVEDTKRFFCISLTPVEKSNQSADGGWRWHKWGEYIGSQEPTTEYIYDEPLIDKVYCYHIYEILDGAE